MLRNGHKETSALTLRASPLVADVLPVPKTESERYSEEHSFTLRDISEALEMDDEQDPNNSKGGYTPNVIGAQEVYKDPRERIKAEKMRNKPQKIIAGPEKLSIKDKMRLFEEESQTNSEH